MKLIYPFSILCHSHVICSYRDVWEIRFRLFLQRGFSANRGCRWKPGFQIYIYLFIRRSMSQSHPNLFFPQSHTTLFFPLITFKLIATYPTALWGRRIPLLGWDLQAKLALKVFAPEQAPHGSLRSL